MPILNNRIPMTMNDKFRIQRQIENVAVLLELKPVKELAQIESDGRAKVERSEKEVLITHEYFDEWTGVRGHRIVRIDIEGLVKLKNYLQEKIGKIDKLLNI